MLKHPYLGYPSPVWCNCFFWAHYMRWTKGGYIARRRSKYGWWYHRLWSPDLKTWYAYAPFLHSNHIIRKFLFRGFIEINDASYFDTTNKLQVGD